MYLTWPEIQQMLREAVRIVRDGGTILVTQLAVPGFKQRGSILEPIPMRNWPPAVAALGGSGLTLRYHTGTDNICRYYATFTKGPDHGTRTTDWPATQPEGCAVLQ